MSVLIVLLLSQASADAWTLVGVQDGVTLESRPVKGSDLYEYRAAADTDVAVDLLCDKIFDWGSLSKDHDNLKVRKVIEDTGDSRVVYDQLEFPMVARRDFAFTSRRTHGGPDRCSIGFWVSNDRAPPVPSGAVRLSQLRGSWQFTRTSKGSHVVYTCFADPGGSLPSFFVHNSQRDAAVNTLKKGIHIAHAPSALAR